MNVILRFHNGQYLTEEDGVPTATWARALAKQFPPGRAVVEYITKHRVPLHGGYMPIEVHHSEQEDVR